MAMSGILIINKEQGYTSFDVVAKLRGILQQKKIGHTGTLDPDATGVLPVCIGAATKVCGLLTDLDKTYQATLLLGVETDTQDLAGMVLREQDMSQLAEEQIREAVHSFEGPYEQIPPMYSAIKVNGRKLYELARAGQQVERKPRPVRIEDITIDHIHLPEVVMTVTCSKGTYIRTLCHDIGEKLGGCACMKTLVRKRVGSFVLEDSVSLREVEQAVQTQRITDILLPVDQMFSDYPKAFVRGEAEKKAYNGNGLSTDALEWRETGTPGLKDGDRCRLYDAQGNFLAVYGFHADKKMWKPVKMFLPGV